MDIIENTGERREMIDQLLGQASKLLMDGGRCYFTDCYGAAEALMELTVSGSKGAIHDEFVVCINHHRIVQIIMDALTDDELIAGFFMSQLDPARTPIGVTAS